MESYRRRGSCQYHSKVHQDISEIFNSEWRSKQNMLESWRLMLLSRVRRTIKNQFLCSPSYLHGIFAYRSHVPHSNSGDFWNSQTRRHLWTSKTFVSLRMQICLCYMWFACYNAWCCCHKSLVLKGCIPTTCLPRHHLCYRVSNLVYGSAQCANSNIKLI